MMKVDVYKNLTAGNLSVRSRETENYGIVTDHVQEAMVKDAEFVVQPSGLKRFKETGIKNVHAFVRGKMVDEYSMMPSLDDAERVRYNPKVQDHFFLADTGEHVESAQLVWLSLEEGGMFVWDYTTLGE